MKPRRPYRGDDSVPDRETGWISRNRIPEWISRQTGRSTSAIFWEEVVRSGRLEVRREGRRILVSVDSLRRYTGRPR